MKQWTVFLFLLPFVVSAHPGIGIVKNSKGNIYYTDLEQVWKIANGIRSVAVPNVHTHELYMDDKDNLYGEHLRYAGEGANKYYHYLWVLKTNGDLDTLQGPMQAYVQTDYSLARDANGTEYYIKQTDSSRIFKKLPGGHEMVFATGNFAGVTWLHPQKKSGVLLIQNNSVYKIDSGGKSTVIAKDIASKNPTFKFSATNRMAWGVWQDADENVYVAVFSDQVVKKISPNGRLSIVHTSAGDWTPLHGVFDNNNQLWILEASDKNEVQVVLANPAGKTAKQEKHFSLSPLLLSGIAVLVITAAYLFFRIKR